MKLLPLKTWKDGGGKKQTKTFFAVNHLIEVAIAV